jgi:hypothetical protein
MSSCIVCLDDYKGKKIVKVNCQYCPAHACRGCTQRYLLQSYEDPHCMECKRGWASEFMAANFPLSFRNDTLRKHRRKVLFEREKTVLPALQIYVEYKKDYERLNAEYTVLRATFGNDIDPNPENKAKLAFRYRALVSDLARLDRMLSTRRQEIALLKTELNDRPKTDHPSIIERLSTARKDRDTLKDRREAALKEVGELRPLYNETIHKLNELTRGIREASHAYQDLAGAPRERREFIMRCPAENCRGFLSTAYKCGTCDSWACKDCAVCLGKDNEVEHTCNPEMVETAKAIRSETRPCPKCGTRIFKIDGCDQMFCVMEGCGTAFSWNTGHIVTGVVHNPHYYEWLRRNGGAAPAREVGDIPCGGMPATWQFIRCMHGLTIPNDIKTVLMETFRNMQELVADRIGNYPARMPQLMNKDDDVAYLMNRLNEEEWKRQLEISEARFNRKKEIGQILQTLITAGSDMMNRLYEKASNLDDTEAEIYMDVFVGWLLDTCIPEFEQLRNFGNESLRALGKRDRMAVPQLEEMWKWKGGRALYKTKAVKGEVITTAEVTEVVG